MTMTINACVERRLLVNWRADPGAIAPLLPSAFRPQLVAGYAVVGICFVRLGHLRPGGIPTRLGIGIESAAHRIAVERETPDGIHRSVYIVQRTTNSRVAVLAGGRLFPGVHSHASFDVHEIGDQLDISFAADADQANASVSVRLADGLASQLFANMDVISTFFRQAPVGWSPNLRRGSLDGVELASDPWSMTPATIQHVRSSYFDDPQRFPPGSIEVHSAVAMYNLPVSWRRVHARRLPSRPRHIDN
jgi:hypothetical protein